MSVLPVARVQCPSHGRIFQGIFFGLITSANPSWASVAENGSISLQWHHTACGQRGGRPKYNYGQKMAEKWNVNIYELTDFHIGLTRNSMLDPKCIIGLPLSTSSTHLTGVLNITNCFNPVVNSCFQMYLQYRWSWMGYNIVNGQHISGVVFPILKGMRFHRYDDINKTNIDDLINYGSSVPLNGWKDNIPQCHHHSVLFRPPLHGM